MAIWHISTLLGIFALDYELEYFRPLWESPMEGLFYQEARGRIDGLELQYKIGRYRVDFAIPSLKIAIEIDGEAYHGTRIQKRRDAARQKWLEDNGWIVLRFSGKKVYNNAGNCINEVQRLVFCIKYNQPTHWVPRYYHIEFLN